MRSSAFVLCALLSATACTESQDLGDRPKIDVDGSVPGDGEPSDGEPGTIDGDGVWDEDGTAPVDPPEQDFELGEFASFDIVARGVADQLGGATLIGVTSVSGPTGCGLVGDESGAPGELGARAYAMIYTQDGDDRCPEGTFAIRDDAEHCARDPGIREGCGLYQRWNAAGELEANLLATGGAVSLTLTRESDEHYVCNVELSLRFAGGRVDESYSFAFNPFEAGGASCTR